MTRFPTSRRVVPTSLMALGFAATVLGLLGISPVSADEGSFGEEVPVTIDTSSGQTTTIPETTTTVPQTTTTVPQTTTTVPQTTTTVPQTTTTVPQTTTTVPQTTTTVPETTTTVPQTTTTAAVTTTTAPATTTTVAVSVLPTTTIRWYTTSTGSLAVTGSDTSLPMVGIGAGLFVAGVVLLRVRTRREA